MRFWPTLLFVLFAVPALAQSPGDIAIIGMNADNPDRFAFVALAPLSAGTVIHFTDNGWRDDGTFRPNEGTYSYTVPSAGLAAGDVIEVESPSGMAFATSGDQIIAYIGDESSPTFIYALNVSGEAVWQDTAANSNTSALPPGLANGSTAVAVTEFDNVAYVGTTSGTRSELLTAIGNPQNWQGNNSAAQTFAQSFTVSGTGSNLPPVFTTALTDQAVIADVEFAFDYVATDPDGDAVTYNVFSGPGAIDASTGRYTWTPSSTDIGERIEVSIRASDGQGFVITVARLEVTAEGGNTAPRFVFILGGERAVVGTPASMQVKAEDDQGDELTYSVAEGVGGVTFEPADDGFVNLNYTPTEVGVERFVVRVNDGEAGSFDERVIGIAGLPQPASGGLFPELFGSELKAALGATYAPDQTLGYTDGRDTLYARVSSASGSLLGNPGSRIVRGLYTTYAGFLDLREDPSTQLFNIGINAEHVWPQSLGAADEPQRSDMHILYPARANVNSARGNMPYGYVADSEAQAWFLAARTTNTIPDDPSGYSRYGGGRFEPWDFMKGDIARAIFYFWTIYPEVADQSFFDAQVETLLEWNEQDPPSPEEAGRSARIQHYQGNPNPFILDTSLMQRIQNPSLSSLEEPRAVSAKLDLYPNPSATYSTVRLDLALSEEVVVDLYDVLGRRIQTLHTGMLPSGRHHFSVDAGKLAAGSYLVRLNHGRGIATRTLSVVR
ncbi:MAG: hypothetical protein RhofKO_25710 [Rhodothermales bacterium]